jgi:hypothetical protein
MTPALALALIGGLLSDLPMIISDVELLISSIKGTAPADVPPMLPEVESAMAPLLARLRSGK